MQKRRARASAPPRSTTRSKVLARVLHFAREQGVPCAAPRITRLKVRRSQAVKAWTPAEVGTLLTKVRELVPEILSVVVSLANTGYRKGEAIALRWEHVDLERRVVRIESTASSRRTTGRRSRTGGARCRSRRRPTPGSSAGTSRRRGSPAVPACPAARTRRSRARRRVTGGRTGARSGAGPGCQGETVCVTRHLGRRGRP